MRLRLDIVKTYVGDNCQVWATLVQEPNTSGEDPCVVAKITTGLLASDKATEARAAEGLLKLMEERLEAARVLFDVQGIYAPPIPAVGRELEGK